MQAGIERERDRVQLLSNSWNDQFESTKRLFKNNNRLPFSAATILRNCSICTNCTSSQITEQSLKDDDIVGCIHGGSHDETISRVVMKSKFHVIIFGSEIELVFVLVSRFVVALARIYVNDVTNPRVVWHRRRGDESELGRRRVHRSRNGEGVANDRQAGVLVSTNFADVIHRLPGYQISSFRCIRNGTRARTDRTAPILPHRLKKTYPSHLIRSVQLIILQKLHTVTSTKLCYALIFRVIKQF